MDIGRRREANRSAVAAGSIWESRMIIDEVKGGIKVFNGDNKSDERVETQNVLPKRSKSLLQIGKRKTWKSQGSDAPVIHLAKSNPEENHTKNSPMQRKPRLDPTTPPVHLRKTRSEKGSVSESVDAKKSFFKFRKTVSDVNKVVDGSNKTVTEASEKKMENTSVDLEEAEEICKEFDVCQEKIVTSSLVNASQIKSPPDLMVRGEGDEERQEINGEIVNYNGSDIKEIDIPGDEAPNTIFDEEKLEIIQCCVKQPYIAISPNLNELLSSPSHSPAVNRPSNSNLDEQKLEIIHGCIKQPCHSNPPNLNKFVSSPSHSRSVNYPSKSISDEGTLELNQKIKPISSNLKKLPPPVVVHSLKPTSDLINLEKPSPPFSTKQSTPSLNQSLSTVADLGKQPPHSITNIRREYFRREIPVVQEFQKVPEPNNKLQNLVDFLMWKDVSKSALVFGFGTFFMVSFSYTEDFNISLISILSYLALIYLAAIFLYKSIICRGAVDTYDSTKYHVVGEEEAIWLLKLFLPYINEFLLKVGSLFSGDPATTIKLAVLLFFLARSGSSITVWKMIKLGFFGAFTVPKIYSLYSVQITGYGKFWIERFHDAWESCSQKRVVAGTVFVVVWNLSSVVARIWAVFVLFAAVRYYQQCLVRCEEETEEDFG